MTTATTSSISEMLRQDPKRIFQLAELAEINIADYGVEVNGHTICVQKGERDFFHIKDPTTITIDVTEIELASLEDLLRKKSLGYTVHHIAPYWGKGQGPVWRRKLEFGTYTYGHGFEIILLDFGASYGEIKINNEVVATISHSGGTGPEGTWHDYTTGFYIIGGRRLAAAVSIINSLKP